MIRVNLMESKFIPLAEKWNDALDVSSISSDEGIAVALLDLHESHRGIDALDVPPCMITARNNISYGMEMQTRAIELLLKKGPEEVAKEYFRIGEDKLNMGVDLFYKAIDCAPFCTRVSDTP